MTWTPLFARRLIVRFALVFTLVQMLAIVGVLFALPAMQEVGAGPMLVIVTIVTDLGILVVLAGWVIRGSIALPIERLAVDVHRIADGDYRHRIAETHRVELLEIRSSVNRLADRLIADQRLLAENVHSLEEANRKLVVARDQIVRSAKLASVGTLAAGIAHEVGNPLGAIMGFVDVARGRVATVGGDVEILDDIRSEANRIDRIVRGLLDYSRPPDHDGPLAAGEVLDRVHRILDSQGKLEGVHDVWLVEAGAEHEVGEPHRLEQVLVNVILNALHAVREVPAPQVVVRLSEEEGGLARMPSRRDDDPPGINYQHRRRLAQDELGTGAVENADRLMVIEVSDNGPGIADDIVDRLFDPFFTTKEPGEGTGLGLSICARLIDGMGGRIDATATPEGGARFVIRLPVSYDTAVATTEIAAQPETLDT